MILSKTGYFINIKKTLILTKKVHRTRTEIKKYIKFHHF